MAGERYQKDRDRSVWTKNMKFGALIVFDNMPNRKRVRAKLNFSSEV